MTHVTDAIEAAADLLMNVSYAIRCDPPRMPSIMSLEYAAVALREAAAAARPAPQAGDAKIPALLAVMAEHADDLRGSPPCHLSAAADTLDSATAAIRAQAAEIERLKQASEAAMLRLGSEHADALDAGPGRRPPGICEGQLMTPLPTASSADAPRAGACLPETQCHERPNGDYSRGGSQ